MGGSIAAGREQGGGAVVTSFLEHAWLGCASGAGPAAPGVLHEDSEGVMGRPRSPAQFSQAPSGWLRFGLGKTR